MALRLAIDTNAYSAMARGEEAMIEIIETAESIHLPFIVLGELRAGFAVGTKGAENDRVLTRFIALPDVTVLHSSDATVRHYAMLYRQLRSQGTPVPTNDLWIAAMTIEHELVLCSRDRHFVHLPQLNVVAR